MITQGTKMYSDLNECWSYQSAYGLENNHWRKQKWACIKKKNNMKLAVSPNYSLDT